MLGESKKTLMREYPEIKSIQIGEMKWSRTVMGRIVRTKLEKKKEE